GDFCRVVSGREFESFNIFIGLSCWPWSRAQNSRLRFQVVCHDIDGVWAAPGYGDFCRDL
ncbi:MAG TPA: hypothetical protein VN042_06695, partial [Asticcacaulis sp.]|nr:hypothetical protein [Asticcacaulis sp.]